MSFLARRVAASEGAFFSETSKNAIARLREKAGVGSSASSPSSANAAANQEDILSADVLPEVLQHSLPRCPVAHEHDLQLHYSLPSAFLPTPSSLASSLPSSLTPRPQLPPHADRLGSTGLSAFLPNLPQASFGPRRWRPEVDEVIMLTSTANEARMDGLPTIDDDARAKALMDGYSVVMKAFLVSTAIVFGGAILTVGVVSSKLGIHSIEDIRTKGKEHMQPRAEAIRQRAEPWKEWLHQRRGNWKIGDGNRHDAVRANFAKVLGARQMQKEDVKSLEMKTS